jgi:DNA-binding PadR family transcriptional regulator
MVNADADEYLPLSSASLNILVALAGEDLHGYGIMQEVLKQSDGKYKLGPGTLYDNLQKLLDQKLIEPVARRSSDDPRRRYYRLTALGKGVISAEILRLEAAFRKAKPHLMPKPRKA